VACAPHEVDAKYPMMAAALNLQHRPDESASAQPPLLDAAVDALTVEVALYGAKKSLRQNGRQPASVQSASHTSINDRRHADHA